MTRLLDAHRRRREATDAGFTLVEVVVALLLLGIVAASALAFFVRSMQSSSHLQRSQAAQSVATQAMELARSVSPRAANAAGTSGLLIGRAKADVDTVWSTAAPADVAQTNEKWDPAAATSVNASVPLVRTTRISDQTFTVTTLIGTCFRVVTASAGDQPCTKIDPGNAAELFRVTAVVTWKPTKAGVCKGATLCVYRETALIDPTVDANWNLTAKPVAYDDAITLNVGGAQVFSDILANDVMGPVTANPTTVTVNPNAGLVGIIQRTSGLGMGGIDIKPSATASGVTTMSYRLRDAAGRTSNEAVVSIIIAPVAVNDGTVAVLKGVATTFDPVANDKGTFSGSPGLRLVSPPSTATVVNGKIVFKATATGNTTITYAVTDTSGTESNTATVTFSATTPTPPKSSALVKHVAYSAAGTSVNLDVLNLSGNSPASSYQILVDTQPSKGSVSLGSAGTVANFAQPAQLAPGTYSFTYRVAYVDGTSPSAASTYQVIVDQPLAVADTFTVSRATGQVTLDLAANDAPPTATWVAGSLRVEATNLSAGCGSLGLAAADIQAGKVKYTPPTLNKTCTFDYQLKHVTDGSIASNKVTVTLTVVN